MKAGDKVKEECPLGKTRPQGQGSAEDSDKGLKDTACSGAACRAVALNMIQTATGKRQTLFLR